MVHMPAGALGSRVTQLTVLPPPRLWLSINSSHFRYAIIKESEITLKTAPRKVLIIKDMTVTIRELIVFLFSFFETGSHVAQNSFECSMQQR